MHLFVYSAAAWMAFIPTATAFCQPAFLAKHSHIASLSPQEHVSFWQPGSQAQRGVELGASPDLFDASSLQLPSFGGVGLLDVMAILLVGTFLFLNYDYTSFANQLPSFVVASEEDRDKTNYNLQLGLLYPLIGFAVVFILRNMVSVPLSDTQLGVLLIAMAVTPYALGLIPRLSDLLDKFFFVPIYPTWENMKEEEREEMIGQLEESMAQRTAKRDERASAGATAIELSVRQSELDALQQQLVELQQDVPTELRRVLATREEEYQVRLAAGAPVEELDAWTNELNVREGYIEFMETELRARKAEIGWKQWFTVLGFLLTLQVFLESQVADQNIDGVLRDSFILWASMYTVAIAKIRREAKEGMIAQEKRFGIQAWHSIVVVAMWDVVRTNPTFYTANEAWPQISEFFRNLFHGG